MEQLSLFDNIGMTKEQFAERILKEFNNLETVWKGKFYIEEIELSHWHHIDHPHNKILTIMLKAKNNRDNDNYFLQFAGDPESQKVVYNADIFSEYLGKLSKDKDFSIAVTPWFISIYWHNFELKEIPA